MWTQKGTARNQIIDFKFNELNSRQPRLAVILGKDTTGSSNRDLVKFFHILDETTSHEDFYLLLERKVELVENCMTSDKIKSALVNQAVRNWDYNLSSHQSSMG